MRSFEERKAEILRRSNKRISKRKTVKRCVLCVTIPLFICAVSLSVLLNIHNSDKTETAQKEAYESFCYNNVANGVTADSLYTCDNRVTVTNSNGEVKNFADSNTVNEIIDIINEYLPSLPQSASDVGDVEFATGTETATAQGNTKNSDNNTAQRHNANCRIEIVDSTGDKTVYTLNGNLLTNIGNGKSVKLEDSVRDKLLKNLGF